MRQAIRSFRANGQLEKAYELEDYLAGPLGDEDPPEDAEFIWRAFMELSSRRSVGASMGGVVLSPVTHSAILEWSRAQGLALTPWEISCISRLDDLYLDTQRKHMTERQNKKR